MKVRIKESLYGEDKQVLFFEEFQLNMEARLAVALLERWGPVVGAPDGEDSAGRMKVRPMTPRETVAQAFDIAEEAMRAAAERGLLVESPDLNLINAEADAEAKRKADAKREKATA